MAAVTIEPQDFATARELPTLTSCCSLLWSGVLFIEAAALATGIVLTWRITRAVAPTYTRTQYVQAMDFSHRRPNREARPTG